MPPSSSIRRRKRSIELANDAQHLRDIARRRTKFSHLFRDRMHQQHVPNNEWRWDTQRLATAHNGTFVDYEFRVDGDHMDLLHYMSELSSALITKLRDAWSTASNGALSFTLEVRIKYLATDRENTTSVKDHTSEYYPVYTGGDIVNSAESACQDIIFESEYYQNGHSNWTIDHIYWAILKYQFVSPARSLTGGGKFAHLLNLAGRSYIELPLWLKNKKCVINVKNDDDFCFKYAMECALNHHLNGNMKHADVASQYHYVNSFNYDDLEWPIHPLDLEKFESLNKHTHNLAINVYTIGERHNEIAPVYCSTNYDNQAWFVHLLLITEEKKYKETNQKKQVNTHWLYISNFRKFLMQPGIPRDNVFCKRCCQNFTNQEKLDNHFVVCKTNDYGNPILPYEYEKWKYFSDHKKMLIKPFVIYADFEAFNHVLEHKEGESKTEENRLTEHIGASFCFHTVCRSNPDFNKTVMFSYNKDNLDDKYLVGKEFIQSLETERDRINDLISKHFRYPLDFNSESIKGPENENCVVCGLHLHKGFMPHWSYRNMRRMEDFEDIKLYFARLREFKHKPLSTQFRRVLLDENKAIIDIWDASKPTNNYLGKGHFACGSHRPGRPFYKASIPVLFHNLSNYDAHFIIKALDPAFTGYGNQFNGIATTGDKFMSFSFRGLQFIDSFRFMGASLDSLSQNLLKSGKDKFNNYNDYFKDRTFQVRETLLQKGEFPYEYFNHPRVLKETKLPPIENFYSKLRDSNISEEDYKRAQYVWSITECKTFQEYHDLYLVVDVMLLADVFENFRTLCLKQDRLDPVNYVSLPGYSMDSAFIFAGNKWEGDTCNFPFMVDLFDNTQVDMYTFIEESIRGGVSMCPGRYAKANHEYLDNYNPKEISKYIFYLDANNLYGYAMSEFLPFSNYEWVSVSSIDLMDIPEDFPFGYIFEVDGYFPDDKHNELSDFPPAPLKQKVTEDMISEFSKSMNERFTNNLDIKTEKLLCTLEPRVNYKCYYRTLQLYCKLGFKITKFHRVLKFRQSNWLQKYIHFNTAQRAISKNAFEKDYYKLKNNAVYGKFIQNNRKFSEVQAISPQQEKIEWSPRLRGRIIINENFVLGYFKKDKLELNSPVVIGSVILDHSKYLMYNFYYNVMKNLFGVKLRLLFTDTDSLCMEIIHSHPMECMKHNKILNEWFDLDEYPKDDSYYGHNYQDKTNKKVIGKFKDECVKDGKGVYITEVVALRSKMYSALLSDDTNKKTAKGVSTVAKKRLTHQKYLQCVKQNPDFVIETDEMIGFRSTNNIIHTVSSTKATLSPCDSKLYLIDEITTRPFGHYSIRNNNINHAESSQES